MPLFLGIPATKALAKVLYFGDKSNEKGQNFDLNAYFCLK